jgi:hypothetical protein
MPIPSGTWSANVNGVEAELSLSPPNEHGVFLGRLFETDVRGYWDEVSQAVTFSLTVIFDNATPIVAIFEGYLFRSPPEPAPGRDVVATMTGSFHVTPGNLGLAEGFPGKGSARRNRFGWYASITEIV